MLKRTNVPQDGAKLCQLREGVGKTQSGLAEALEALLKPHMKLGYTIQQADISRLEREDTSIDIPKLLAYAFHFQIDIANLLKPGFQVLCKSDIHLQDFASPEAANEYLFDLERGGRTLVYSSFPSDLFSLDEESNTRYQQIAKPWYNSTEIYTIDAFLSFLFSPVSAYSIDDKVRILTRYLDYFRSNMRHRLSFFSRAALPNLRHVRSMELLPECGLLLVPSPVLSPEQSDAFFEIRGAELFEKAQNFYDQIPMLDGNLLFLRIGLDTLERLRDGSPARDAIRYFYQEVDRRTIDPAQAQEVLENFSPEIQAMIREQSSDSN